MKKKVIIAGILGILICFSAIVGQPNKKSNIIIKMHPSARKSNNSVVGYDPNQIKKAYGIDKLTSQGKGQRIAIIDAYGSPTIENDLNVFNENFDLEPTKLNILYPNGKPTITDSKWGIETSLDVEWVHALAPKANIMLVVSKSESIDDLMDAVDYASKEGANVVTMSWGGSEFSDELSYDSHFNNKKITYIAATGDYGTGTQWPAVCSNVLSVGGTTLVLNSHGGLTQPETAWSCSGGGISSYEAEPEYQNTYGIQSNNNRTIPDVSFCADPGVSVYSKDTGWISFGGTSFGTSAWSAFIACINQERKTPLVNIQNDLYQIAASKKYSSTFRDITSESNGTDNLNNSHEGYDYVTGLGSPIENNIYNNLLN